MNGIRAGMLLILLLGLLDAPAIALEKNVILAVDLAVFRESTVGGETADRRIADLIGENARPGDHLAILAIGERAHLLKGFGDDFAEASERMLRLPADPGCKKFRRIPVVLVRTLFSRPLRFRNGCYGVRQYCRVGVEALVLHGQAPASTRMDSKGAPS
jgi:hypothetical protein